MLLIRQTLFHICFYGYMFIWCLLLAPMLLLPRKQFMKGLQFYFDSNYYVEKFVLGLDYEVRGAEYLPEGACLVAGKHYSTYETFKIHLLFKDPAIILKRELALIPIWGWLALKAGMIAINRSTGDSAMKSILEGAKRLKAENRPVVIFPQGTRVDISDTPANKPYKFGIVRMQEATGLPIIPMATNSGLYWPRRSFFVKPGKVIFEFFPAILPGADLKETHKQMVDIIETNSNRLVQEALSKAK